MESSEKLSVQGMSLCDRLENHMVRKSDKKEELGNIFRFFRNGAENPPATKTDTSKMILKMPEMFERAANGSKTASRFVTGMQLLSDAEECLNTGPASKALYLLNLSNKSWDLLPVDGSTFEEFYKLASQAYDENPQDTEALRVILRYQSKTKFDINHLVIASKECF